MSVGVMEPAACCIANLDGEVRKILHQSLTQPLILLLESSHRFRWCLDNLTRFLVCHALDVLQCMKHSPAIGFSRLKQQGHTCKGSEFNIVGANQLGLICD